MKHTYKNLTFYEKGTYCKGKYTCQWYLGQGIDFKNILKSHMTPLQEDKQPY